MIKGTSIEYLDSQLRLGIRAKEFNMEGELESDCTPFDTDFSEITVENLESYWAKKRGLEGIIESTFTGTDYGSTYYVIKKGSYDETKTYTSGDGTSSKTRYYRTAIGSNAISGIITKEWTEENAYIMAQNEMYIPVVDLDGKKVLFTYDQYESIREKMKGLSFYGADDFEIDTNAKNNLIIDEAKKMKQQAKGTISTEEKRMKIIELVKRNLPKTVVQDMTGDLSNQIVEFIDTGSTGRGTNIPGDGDFDFMLKCSSKDEQSKNIELMKSFFNGTAKGGTNEFNIRYKDVEVEGLDCPVDIDVTSETKKLEVEYSSDMCVRDRLDNIRKNYREEELSQVIDNIIVAKKKLKEMGAYKKVGSDGSTELGGFGGIGVENWILQNGGSFILAMETFLDNARDDNGNEIGFEEFKIKYPIYDFGQNHRESTKNGGHDQFIQGLSEAGFTKMKEQFKELLMEYGIEYEFASKGHLVEPIETKEHTTGRQQTEFFSSIKEFTTNTKEYKISDMSRIYGYLAKYRGQNNIRMQSSSGR